uniref:SWIM-type domain-containing protein n=1 Tax=Heliothis virescens TaxID=7102 RepID=A0A2A4J5H1_HELVI
MYSTWKICELKEELRKRGASLRGRKADLIERLESYDLNYNFGQAVVVDDEPSLVLPPMESYRDINSNTKLPPLNKTQIRHYLSISDKKMDKVEQLYESRHLVTARSFIDAIKNTYLKGTCRKTMKNLHYEVDIKLDEYGSIEETHCECPAGSGNNATCKHVAVLLLGVESMVSKKCMLLFETCTQRLQSFHAPKKPYGGTPVRAEKLPRRRENKSVLFEPYPVKEIDRENYNARVRNLVLNFQNSSMPLKQLYEPANPYAIEVDHDYLVTDAKTKVLLDLQLSVITTEQIQYIEEATREQQTSEEWLTQRRKRLTASNFHTICHLRPTSMKSYASQIQHRIEFRSRATSHGIINEKIALQKYCEMYDLIVLPCGFFVSQERPYLGASPDALLGSDTIIEIKCPYTSRFKQIDPVTVPYLILNGNNLCLKPNTPYYYQIQGQLYCSGRKYCNLIVYTFKDLKVIYVYRDENFINYMLSKLDEFFNNYFKPEIFKKYLYYNYDVYNNK